MKLLFSHENAMIVNNIRNILEAEGVSTYLKNEYASGGVGELAPNQVWPEIWVMNEGDYDRGRAIVENIALGGSGKQWTCPACNELNEPAFEVCWNCQNEKA
jgi:hypothetical protein